MKSLVLGATGFIGGQIARAALDGGWEVRALRRNPKSVGDLEGLPIEWVAGNITNSASLRAAMQGVEIVFHAAAYYPSGTHPRQVPAAVAHARQEIETVLNALRAAQVPRLIFTSTLSTIGQPPPGEKRLADERDTYSPGSMPKNAYYECKIAMENAVLAANDIDAVVLCPTAVFGPGDVHLTMGKLLISVARGRVPAWLPGIINAIDVRDVAATHIIAAQHGQRGERYILGGHNFTVEEALRQAARAANVTEPRFEIPLWVTRILVTLDDALPFISISGNHLRALPHWQGYNTSKAQTKLGLKPRPFEETARDALSWFEQKGYL
ncbi:MAG: NAD-dependent epimerase/dehydratase family protein [Anaerolineae bacterium]|nr:NAD-dependent epimerase/dehydratase family protein [Anaerolineae bacterium]MBL6964940.1 NAD-dependent epimerase/dehydratase family protein [Anaerolineales bacterium]